MPDPPLVILFCNLSPPFVQAQEGERLTEERVVRRSADPLLFLSSIGGREGGFVGDELLPTSTWTPQLHVRARSVNHY